MAGRRPRLTVVGLGPAGPALRSEQVSTLVAVSPHAFLRTARHPAAQDLLAARTFDWLYDTQPTFEDVYTAIVEELVRVATRVSPEPVVYAVPGSPLVAERTVELLRADATVDLTVVPALSFLDLAWERLGIDPLREQVRLVDAPSFPLAARTGPSPFLIAQCWTRQQLSEVKLTVPDGALVSPPRPVILHHLGLDDEVIAEVDWWELDRTVEPDHLTSVYVPATETPLATAAGADVIRLVQLMDTLRVECPWDRAQSHGTLMPHLVEECYEVLDALSAHEAGDEDSYRHLQEELGDLLFQIVFHARLASEQDAFDLNDVARGIHDKLVSRHPHVFGDGDAVTPDQVLSNWETIKKREKGRSSVTEGIPTGLPALMLTTKLARKSRSVGLEPRATDAETAQALLARLGADASTEERHPDDPLSNDAREETRLVGELLFAVAELAARLGVDAEQALRARALVLRDAIVAAEGVPDHEMDAR